MLLLRARGQLHDLYKKQGDEGEPSNRRDVLLADEVGKAMQANSRARLNKVVGVATVTHSVGIRVAWGGYRCCPYVFRCLLQSCSQTKSKYWHYFLDVKIAYATVQRSSFLEIEGQGPDPHEKAYLDALQRLGLNEADSKEVYREIKEMQQWIPGVQITL